jgi:DNA-directed RNA polymerase specialized sigma24 family protein
VGLLETLVLGSYVWSTSVAAWLYRKITNNHIKHLEERVKHLELATRVKSLEDHNPH